MWVTKLAFVKRLIQTISLKSYMRVEYKDLKIKFNNKEKSIKSRLSFIMNTMQ